jgi:signal transduction histidine kinase
VDFLAPGNPFGDPVLFEVVLEGSGGALTSTVISSPAVFNQLHEDDYVLHVRPRAGRVEGTEATLQFSIRPPWYRTAAAFVAYAFSAIAIVWISSWVFSFLERREKARLERVVAFRTNELEQKAAALAASEDRYRNLSKDLEKRVEERTSELHGANEQLLSSNRELEAFSYSVSHDLRAPLRNIRGFASLLERRAESVLDSESKRFLDIVSGESTRLADLIDSLLAFSRLNRAELKKQDLDLRPLIEAVRTDLEEETDGRHVEWIIGRLPKVHGDPTLIRQVLTNLISNALKFSRTRDPAVITIDSPNGTAKHGEIVFFVRDNGVGFDPTYAEKLFGVFQRLHSGKEFEGSGIGLATVKRIITRHGGRIWAEGAPDSGATVYFTLKIPGSG